MEADALGVVREALERHDWQAAFDEATASLVESRAAEAQRADLLAEAAWWLGRLEACIEVREQAYLIFDELGDKRAAGRCAVGLWEHHGMRGHPAMAGAWLRRARRSLEGEPPCVELGASAAPRGGDGARRWGPGARRRGGLEGRDPGARAAVRQPRG